MSLDSEAREMLREWLVKNLEPICDADPDVLSKYVLALVQNDPKKDGLQEICVGKLEEFLGDETKGFVFKLLGALKDESYRPNRHKNPDKKEDTLEVDNEEKRRRDRSISEDGEKKRQTKRRRSIDSDQVRNRDRRSPRHDGDRRRGYNSRDGRGKGRGRDRDSFGDRRRLAMGGEWGRGAGRMMPRGWDGVYRTGGRMGIRGRGDGNIPPEYDPDAYNPENPSGGAMGMVGMMPGHLPPGMMGPNGPMMGYAGPMPMGIHGGRNVLDIPRGMRSGRGADHRCAPGGRGDSNGSIPKMSKTTLRIINVDPQYINMIKLTMHFSKFGNVVNVQMRPQFKCAYVQYETEEMAQKAFHSPIPVCNNRFIQVRWAKFDPSDPHGAPSLEEQREAESREVLVKDKQKSNEEMDIIQPSMTAEEAQAAAAEKGKEILEKKRLLMEKQKELNAQKEVLLQQQLNQYEILLEKMKNNSQVSEKEKDSLIQKISDFSSQLHTLRVDSGKTISVDSKEEPIAGLKSELSALQSEANDLVNKTSHITSRGRVTTGSGRGSGRFAGGRWGYGRNGRGRGGRGGRGRMSNTLDNRTTVVKVTSLPEEARDESVLNQHFGHFGEILKLKYDANVDETTALIQFKSRYSGQAALKHGAFFGESPLTLTWADSNELRMDISPKIRDNSGINSLITLAPMDPKFDDEGLRPDDM